MTEQRRAKSFNRKRLLIAASVLLSILIAIAIFNNREFHSRDVLRNPRLGFQFLEPLEVPPGFQITASRINIFSEANKIYGISAEMNLRTVDWVYEIQESKYERGNIHTSLNNFSVTSVKPTCIQETSADKRSYRLCHWIDYGRISVYEVEFVQDGVFIDTRFPATLHQNVPLSALNAYVDSFVPAAPPETVISGI